MSRASGSRNQRADKSWRWWAGAGVVLLALGLGGLGWFAWPDVQLRVIRLAGSAPLSGGPARAAEGSRTPTRADDRVRVPSVGIDVPISAGRDWRHALETGVWLQAGTAPPGGSGNTVLAGHRVARVFARLHGVRVGEPIDLRWRGELRRYRVLRVYDVPPTDTSILSQDGTERLTLYTCIPRIFGNRRTVVVAAPSEP